MKIYEKMKESREKAGLRQGEVARAIGKTQQQYSEYEIGKRQFPITKVVEFCRTCKISPNELFEWSQEE